MRARGNLRGDQLPQTERADLCCRRRRFRVPDALICSRNRGRCAAVYLCAGLYAANVGDDRRFILVVPTGHPCRLALAVAVPSSQRQTGITASATPGIIRRSADSDDQITETHVPRSRARAFLSAGNPRTAAMAWPVMSRAEGPGCCGGLPDGARAWETADSWLRNGDYLHRLGARGRS